MTRARFAAAWRSFWFAPAAPQPLALCRIVLCAAIFLLYAGEDFRFVATLAPLHWKPIGFLRLLAPDGPPSEAALAIAQNVWRIALLAAAAGIATRVSTAIAALGAAYLMGLTYCVARVSHEMAAVTLALAVLALSRCGDAWSVDAALARRGAVPASAEYRWPIQLVRILISLAFCSAGLSKLRDGGLAWIFSDSLLLTIADRAVPLGLWIVQWPWLCRALAGGVVAVELFHPFALVSRRAAAILVPSGIAMLLGFWLVLGVPFWPLLALHVFWMPWDWLVAAAERGATRYPLRATPRRGVAP